MSAKRLRVFVILTASISAVAQQPKTPSRPPLATVLNTPEHQWVFNHICVPVRMLSGSGYTNGDFVGAYYAVLQSRWEASLEAQHRGDEDGSMNAIAPILHGVIDLHWPNRVERDSSGAITRFRDCEELGNLQGVLREEKTTPGPTGEVKQRATSFVSQVIRKWKDGRPFEEVTEILRSGPMRLSEAHATVLLGQK